jgi:hypothetical protein
MVQVGFIQWDADEMNEVSAFTSLQRTLSMSPIFLHPSGSPVLDLCRRDHDSTQITALGSR